MFYKLMFLYVWLTVSLYLYDRKLLKTAQCMTIVMFQQILIKYDIRLKILDTILTMDMTQLQWLRTSGKYDYRKP